MQMMGCKALMGMKRPEQRRIILEKDCSSKKKKDNNDSERTVGRPAAVQCLRFTTGSSFGGGAPQDPVQEPS